jgi:hypothetical protein
MEVSFKNEGVTTYVLDVKLWIVVFTEKNNFLSWLLNTPGRA